MKFYRYYFPGQLVFITQVVQKRIPVFSDIKNIDLFWKVINNVKKYHPHNLIAYVLLPDHFHLIIESLENTIFSHVMHSLKRNFTLDYKKLHNINAPIQLWQNRFWDHIIRNENDLENHLHYIHNNPAKHGLIEDAFLWKNSSILDWQKRGLYPDDFHWVEPLGNSWGE